MTYMFCSEPSWNQLPQAHVPICPLLERIIFFLWLVMYGVSHLYILVQFLWCSHFLPPSRGTFQSPPPSLHCLPYIHLLAPRPYPFYSYPPPPNNNNKLLLGSHLYLSHVRKYRLFFVIRYIRGIWGAKNSPQDTSHELTISGNAQQSLTIPNNAL